MQMVIEIDIRVYGLLKYFESALGLKEDDDVKTALMRAVINGTPLPKGHGDLTDRDAINSRYNEICAELESLSNKPTYKELLDKLSMCLDTAPTIIEADKAESEEINCKTTKCVNCKNHNYCDYES